MVAISSRTASVLQHASWSHLPKAPSDAITAAVLALACNYQSVDKLESCAALPSQLTQRRQTPKALQQHTEAHQICDRKHPH